MKTGLFFRSQRGSTVAIAITVAVAAAILIAGASRNLLFYSHQVVYFNAMNRAYRLAESVMTRAVGKLTADPAFYITEPWTNVPGDSGETYSVQISSSGKVIGSGYYIVTTASVTVGGRVYSTRLHSHIRISNTGEYFWACANMLKLTPGINAANGKVYAPQLVFLGQFSDPPQPAIASQIGRAEYRPEPYGSFTDESGLVTIVEAPNTPVALEADIVFPQVLDKDIDRYKLLANMDPEDLAPDHVVCNFDYSGAFTGANYLDIYPPGYINGQEGGDPYLNHTDENADHVYFCDGPLKIGYVRVHGQVLFVATGDIEITGDIIRQSADISPQDPMTFDNQFPGFGVTLGSSTAHQAVLITQSDVIVSTNNYLRAQAAVAPRMQTIEAMILAPHGELSALPYLTAGVLDETIRNNLSLTIRGSMVLGAVRSIGPYNLPTVFKGGRTYAYTDSLKTNPPPYLPALAEIYYSFEETLGAGSIF